MTTRRRLPPPGTIRSAGTTLADQAASSGTNLLMVLAVAQRVSPEAFGSFAIACAALVLVLGCCRTWLGMPVALSTSLDPVARRRLVGGAGLLVVAASPIVVVGIGVLLPGALAVAGTRTSSSTFVLVGVAAVLACLQDLTRYAAVAAGSPGRALAADVVWLVGACLLLVAPVALAESTIMAVWVGIVAASAAAGLALTRPIPSMRDARRLLASGGGARSGSTIVALLATGTALALSALVATGFSTAASGSLLGAGTLLGPVNLLLALLDLAVLGRLVDLPRLRRRRLLTRALAGLWAVQLVWMAGLLVLPTPVGVALLGPTWGGAREILPLVGVEYAVAAAVAVVSLELKVRDLGGAMVLARVAACLVVLGGTAVLAAAAAPFAAVPIAMLCGTLAALAIVVAGARAVGRAPSTASEAEVRAER